MSTRTSSRPTRSTRQSTGRFARSTSTPRRAAPASRRSAPRRYGMAGGVLQRRRTPPPSGLKGALAGLRGLLPAAGKARRTATPSSKKGKAGGFAVLTAAAGYAFSHRDKLGRLVKRDRSPAAATETTPATPPPATAP